MQTPEHVERVAAEAVVDLAADGVVYAEVRFAPELHVGMSPQAAIEAVAAGFRRGEQEAAAAGRPISAWVICCAMRTADRSLEVARLVDPMRDREPKVVAFDLAGAETGFPPSLHAEALAFARQHHLNVTIHASEPPDLELIDDALVARRPPHRPRRAPRARHDAAIPTRRAVCASVRWPATCSIGRSTSSWRRRATSRSAPSAASPSTRSGRSCGPGSRSA